jgi:hypothetical protein
MFLLLIHPDKKNRTSTPEKISANRRKSALKNLAIACGFANC